DRAIEVLPHRERVGMIGSYATIEHRGPLEIEVGSNAFGCDICQEVCPWNRDPAPSHEAFTPRRSPTCCATSRPISPRSWSAGVPPAVVERPARR
ncbi:MAG TPA: hypothetical protein VJ901_09625, partial [Thermoanaerobaculia bacterium]|nr:hypothetical protein [Thermoanaerobaculia bacterium]